MWLRHYTRAVGILTHPLTFLLPGLPAVGGEGFCGDGGGEAVGAVGDEDGAGGVGVVEQDHAVAAVGVSEGYAVDAVGSSVGCDIVRSVLSQYDEPCIH